MRQRQLDGVRGVAILMVMAYHHYLLAVGWAGVDLFFVLSGFLITRILLRSRERHHYWLPFYIKRIGRIFPPLLILFPLALAVSHHVTGIGLLGYALFLGNYINLTPYSAALLVMLWSLAIEEHFYVIWPFAIRYLSRTRNIQILCGVLVAEPILRGIAMRLGVSGSAIYYLTWFRLDSIAAGALLALIAEHPEAASRLLKWSLPLCAVMTAVFGICLITHPDTFTKEANSFIFDVFGYTLTAAASFFLIACLAGDDHSRLAKLFSLKPLVFIGEISYGMYLFHPTILATTRKLMHVSAGPASASATRSLFWIDLPLTIVCSWISFRLFESPIIAWTKRKAHSIELSSFHGTIKAPNWQEIPLRESYVPSQFGVQDGLKTPEDQEINSSL